MPEDQNNAVFKNLVFKTQNNFPANFLLTRSKLCNEGSCTGRVDYSSDT
jgi:hypothetical protein